jgi:amino acid adenylation domain-containing protein
MTTDMTADSQATDRLSKLSEAKRLVLESRLKGVLKGPAKQTPIRRRRLDESGPLSFGQLRLWFLHQMDPGLTAYNINRALRIVGPVNIAGLTQGLNEMVRRHHSLRTSFLPSENEPIQIVVSNASLDAPIVDLSLLSGNEQKAAISELAAMESVRPFHLERGSLFRVCVCRVTRNEHVLLYTMHHIISDARSAEVFTEEILGLYRSYSAGHKSDLAEPEIQYADYALWQREVFQGELLQRQLAYWTKRLTGSTSTMALPLDHPRPAVKSFRGKYLATRLPAPLCQALRARARAEKTTLFVVLLAGFNVLLRLYSGQEDLNVGTVASNRGTPETERVIGFFVNTLVMRTDLSNGPSLGTVISRVHEGAGEAFANGELPFERLIQEMRLDRDLSRTPLFEVAFSFQKGGVPITGVDGLEIGPLALKGGSAKYDLTMLTVDHDDRITVTAEYGADLFDSTTVTRMLIHYQSVLDALTANPNRPVSLVAALTEAEQQQSIAEWNDTSSQLSPACFQSLFGEWARQTPDKIAASFATSFGDEFLSYFGLNGLANQFANYLVGTGILPEDGIGVQAPRGLELPVIFLGVLKAGAVFIPIDPVYPRERRAFIGADAGAKMLVALPGTPEDCFMVSKSAVRLDSIWPTIRAEDATDPDVNVSVDNLAYVIYTSGSTGVPKGTQVTHRGLHSLLRAQISSFGVNHDDRVLQFSSPSFDAFVFEMVMSLASGASIWLAPKEAMLPGVSLAASLRSGGITIATLPPSALSAMSEEPFPALSRIIVAGEECPLDLAERWGKGRRFFNAYGPTEATVWSSLLEFGPDRMGLSIGKPIVNCQLYIVDDRFQALPLGAAGELCIGGPGLARGYVNRSSLTAEKFIPDPFGLEPNGRLYRTGDRARYLSDGNVEFLGRFDRQVKIRGFRIELGEIESVLLTNQSVKDAAVIVRTDKPGDTRLVAYVVPRSPDPDLDSELRRHLRNSLPEHMVPSSLVILEVLPLTESGKVDRRALKDIVPQESGMHSGYVAPQDQLEQDIASIWREVLGIQVVGANDNFFDLGGHSLLLTRVHKKLNERLKDELAIVTLFQHPTVRSLAQHIQGVQTGETRTAPTSRHVELKVGKQRLLRQQAKPRRNR